MSMRFPIDSTDSSVGASRSHTERQVYLAPTQGAAAIALPAERDDFLWSPSTDTAAAPFIQPLSWYEGKEFRRLPLPVAERYIPIVERRIEQNHEFLEQYPQLLEDLEHAIEADDKQVANAYAGVQRAVIDDDARAGPGPSPGVIINHTLVIAPDLYLPSRGCQLRDTREWQHWEFVKMSIATDADARKAERGRLQRAFAQEHINKTLLESRLYHLREHIAWWHRQFAGLP